MKRFNLFFLIVLLFFLFSCAGKPKTKSTEDNEPVNESVAEQTDKPAEKTDESAVEEQTPPVELAAAAAEETTDVQAEKPAEEPINEEIAQDDSGNEQIADAASLSLNTEPAANTPSVSPSSSQTQPSQSQTQQPQTQSSQTQSSQTQSSQTQPSQTQSPQTQPSQTQSSQTQQPQAQPTQTQSSQTQQPQAQQPQANPPAQRQQTTTPQSNPPAQRQQTAQIPVQPPTEEKTDSSETASSGDDSQGEKVPSSSILSGNSAPASRIESLTQMGTMPQDKEIIFSRIVRATVGQIVEIPFRGNGWVYLGELTSQRGIVYSSRRNDSDGQSFIFTLEEAGTYALKFYRQDFIRDYIINDHVQVVAGEAPSAGAGWFKPPVERDRVVAQPRWPSAVEETQIRSGTRPASEPVVTSSAADSASVQSTAPQERTVSDQGTRVPQNTTPARETNTADRTPSQNTLPSSAASGQTAAAQTAQSGQTAEPAPAATAEQRVKLAPEVLLQKAKESFDGGNIAAAIALLEQFMTDYPGGSDEAYWRLGQYYEANSPSRNILHSLDYYRRLIDEYPQSGRFNDARRRIAYLERYYINIQ